MLAYCDYNLLKDENTDEVNCEADFHFLVFHQKCTIQERINLCTIPTVVVHLTFCQQIAHFFGDESLYNFCSLHICQCNILPASCLLLASHLHTQAYLTYESHACCLSVAPESLVCCIRVACKLLKSCLITKQ